MELGHWAIIAALVAPGLWDFIKSIWRFFSSIYKHIHSQRTETNNENNQLLHVKDTLIKDLYPDKCIVQPRYDYVNSMDHRGMWIPIDTPFYTLFGNGSTSTIRPYINQLVNEGFITEDRLTEIELSMTYSYLWNTKHVYRYKLTNLSKEYYKDNFLGYTWLQVRMNRFKRYRKHYNKSIYRYKEE